MTDLLTVLLWWAMVTIFGLAAWPLLFRLFRYLPDRGYSFAKTGGLLAVAYVGWLLGNFGFVQVSPGGALVSLALVAVASALAARGQTWADMKQWWAEHRATVIAVEVLFVVAFAAWAYVRALNPNITFTEKPMEFAFLNSVLRTGALPPGDPWLSGFAISYYHFGYIIMGMLIAVSGVLPSVGFNLGIALLFALTAVSAFGIVFNLIATVLTRCQQPAANDPQRVAHGQPPITNGAVWPALLGPLFMLTGNFNGALEVLHKAGLFSPAFWAWLDIKWTNQPPVPGGGWMPDRFLWWWQASRVIHDRGLTGAEVEVIDEFPFFSFLLGDMHPHVLGLPFVFLAIAFALNLFLMLSDPDRAVEQGRSVERPDTGWRAWLPLSWPDLLGGALILGGLSFLNTWDFPIYLFVAVAAFTVARGMREGFHVQVWQDAVMLGAQLAIAGIILYLPFYIGFRSQLGGILPNVIFPTRFAQFFVMFGPSLILVTIWLGWLAWRARRQGQRPDWRNGLGAAVVFLIGLIAVNVILSWAIASSNKPQAIEAMSNLLGGSSVAQALPDVVRTRLARAGTPLLLTLFIGVGAAWVFSRRGSTPEPGDDAPAPIHPAAFVAVLVVTGALLAIAPDFVYLRDLFGSRMNTVFKFYYQAWVVWSLAAAFGGWMLWHELTRWKRAAVGVGVAVMLGLGLVYPALATTTVTDNWRGTTRDANDKHYATLDGMAYMSRDRAADYDAIKFINARIPGRPVMAEAVGGSYTEYGRVSAHTGLPTVLGWPFHELQWRGSGESFAGREDDIRALYSARTWAEAVPILDKYNIRYVYYGSLEANQYGPAGQAKFDQNMLVVYTYNGVTIYERTDK
ncbi:MAG: hypothetical protein HY679_12370 [Chloroflexi bacterium]|nr:hypothetical protein [Chloroflexota bacterium]